MISHKPTSLLDRVRRVLKISFRVQIGKIRRTQTPSHSKTTLVANLPAPLRIRDRTEISRTDVNDAEIALRDGAQKNAARDDST
jgi:hypothetical protein